MIQLKIAFSLFVQWLKAPFKKRAYINKVKAEMERISKLKLPTNSNQPRGTLVIKCDDIGDFILWTPVIETLKQHAEKPIYFVGNQVLRPLYDQWFHFADEVLWIDKSQWDKQAYRDGIYNSVRKWNPQVACTPLFTRHFYLDDMILWASKASEKIAWDVKHHQYYENASFINSFINRTIKTDVPILHELKRNQEFIQKLFEVSSLPQAEWIQVKNVGREDALVVVPNASVKSKQLEWLALADIVKEVIPCFDKIILVGGKDAMERSLNIEAALNSDKVINLCGTKTLVDLVQLISTSAMVLTPDTAALHIAVATHTPTVVVSNGTMVPRFTDYEQMTESYFALVLPTGYSRSKFRVRYSSKQMQLIRKHDVINAIKKGIHRRAT